MNICVYGASSKNLRHVIKDKIELLGKSMGERGHNLVFGGGAEGAMGASARGMQKSGKGKIIGIAPKFMNVDGILFENCSELIFTEGMRDRKQLLEDKSDAFIVAPGGVGTFDEFFEILTLKQLARHNKPLAVFNIEGYYDPLLALMKKAEDEDCLNHATNELYKVFTDIEQMLNYIENYSEELREITYYKDVNTDLK